MTLKKVLFESFKLAKRYALKSSIHNRIAAVLVHKNKIVSVGYNTFKNHNHKRTVITQSSILCS